MKADNIIAFPPRSTEAQIRAEAERRGIPYDDFLVDLALAGWAKQQERNQRDALAIADHALDYAEHDRLAALAILKRAARIILQPSPFDPQPEDAA